MVIKILTTGGSIDKYYSTRESCFAVGEPEAQSILEDSNVTVGCDIESILKKDSLEITEEDLKLIYRAVKAEKSDRIIITHGTDTMIDTAKSLSSISGKVIVLTGAMQPAACSISDAPFNLGFAFAAVQTLPEGVYIAMNGKILDPFKASKNSDKDMFE